MVRFSTVTFWLSFISETASVGTTTLRTARCWPSETMRCSRLCLTLFSCPEYVLTTYQRNIQRIPLAQDEFDDFFCDEVCRAEVGPGDGDEADDDGGRLRDVPAVRPLYALQLGPAGADEADRAVAAAQRGAGRALLAPAAIAATWTSARPPGAAASGAPA